MLLVRAYFLVSLLDSFEVGILEAIGGAYQHLQVLPLQIDRLVCRLVVAELIELLKCSLPVPMLDSIRDLSDIERGRLRILGGVEIGRLAQQRCLLRLFFSASSGCTIVDVRRGGQD